MVDFGGPRPYPAYLREHSPDYGTYHGRRVKTSEGNFGQVPGFKTGTEILRESATTHEREFAHEESESTASAEAGRPWASEQLVFNAGHLCIFRFDDRALSAAVARTQPVPSVPAVAPHFRYIVLIG